ncbi:hypothetical protein HanRHA438_Chr07g0307061 [Helianthus annuus]|nr:hypothetical protein HanRHA438_Chr07g0307061 [Helianthus annuus]
MTNLVEIRLCILDHIKKPFPTKPLGSYDSRTCHNNTFPVLTNLNPSK